MRKLTRDQIIQIFGPMTSIKSAIIHINEVEIEQEEDCGMYSFDQIKRLKGAISFWISKELAQLPEEARQHVEYLTCHPTVIAEISFPDKNLDGNNIPPWSKVSGGASIVVKS